MSNCIGRPTHGLIVRNITRRPFNYVEQFCKSYTTVGGRALIIVINVFQTHNATLVLGPVTAKWLRPWHTDRQWCTPGGSFSIILEQARDKSNCDLPPFIIIRMYAIIQVYGVKCREQYVLGAPTFPSRRLTVAFINVHQCSNHRLISNGSCLVLFPSLRDINPL